MKMCTNDYEARFKAQVDLRVKWLVDNLDPIIYEQSISLDALQSLHFAKKFSVDIPENVREEFSLSKMGGLFAREFRSEIAEVYTKHLSETFGLQSAIIGNWKTIELSNVNN